MMRKEERKVGDLKKESRREDVGVTWEKEKNSESRGVAVFFSPLLSNHI